MKAEIHKDHMNCCFFITVVVVVVVVVVVEVRSNAFPFHHGH